MVLERYRAGWETTLHPAARTAQRLGITPNFVTMLSLVFAIAAAIFFALAGAGTEVYLFVGAACVAVNAILDGLDGRLARLTNSSSKRGDYLDHVVDRYSDAAILLGLALSPLGDEIWGLLALVGTFLTSYMGTQQQALGLGRDYSGWLGRADRLVILIAVPVLTYAAFFLGIAIPWGLNPIVLVLGYFAIVGNLTALQRFWGGWKALSA
ncbi:MAG TPA: CDP-alcohol phosphatidyltransferase family protein [Candidatus Thermoplasmatota archaeon]|nr:CDP-alcohol phosphatidyltransferase family protein [Candidatus Thermoplasmatota archaeon]